MATKRINPRKVKLHRIYSVEDIVRLLGVCKNTVRNWVAKGLEPVNTRRPILFEGATLRAFLEKQQASRKRPCPPGTMFCFGCHEPRPPALGMVDFVPGNEAAGNLKGICSDCGTIMSRRARLTNLRAIMPGIEVQILGGDPRLSGSSIPSLICDLER